MRDSEVVASIVAGDPDGLAAAYDRYADALLGYCRSLLREPADAADAVQDTFVIAASGVAGLREPERLRAWLFAVARNECLRRLRSREAAAPLEDAAERADETVDIGGEAERAETRALIRAAAGGLNAAERDVITLLWHGLEVAEIATVLGVSRNHAHTLFSRARDQLEASIGVLLVGRSGRGDCPALDTLLTGWDGRLTVPLRKRVGRHIDRCPVCSGRRRRELSPAMLLGLSPGALLGVAAARGAAGAAVRAAPAGLRGRALGMATAKDLHSAAYRAAVRRSHGTFGKNGFPRPVRGGHLGPLSAPHARLAAAAGATAVAATVTVLATSGGPQHHRFSGIGPAPGRAGSTLAPSGAAPGASQRAGVAGPSPPGVMAGSGGPATAARPLSATPAASAPPTGSAPPSAGSSPTPTVSASSTGQAARGTVTVTPTTVVLTPLLGGSLRLTAGAATVTWSISEPASLIGELSVLPAAGTLAAGQSVTVTITVSGLASLDTRLTVSPGGQQVTVLLGLG